MLRGIEFESRGARVEVALAVRIGGNLYPRPRVPRLEELGGDGLAFEGAIREFRGVRALRCCTHDSIVRLHR